MIIFYFLHGLTLTVLFLILWGLDRMVVRIQNLHEFMKAIADSDEPAPAPMATPSVTSATVKCRVHGCGWPAVEEGFCEDHLHEH